MNGVSEFLGAANSGWPVEPSAMMLPGRVEGWPAGTQRAASRPEALLSQAVAYWDVAQYRDGDRFLRNRGTGGELLDLRLGSSVAPNSNDPAFLAPEDRGYVYLPGVATNFLSIAAADMADITGDIDIRVRVALDSWASANQCFISRYDNNTLTDRGYEFRINPGGTISLVWRESGGTEQSTTSSVAVSAQDGSPLWVRAALDVDDGSSQNTTTFYTSDDGVTWTQLGTVRTQAGTTNMQSVPGEGVRIGQRSNGTQFPLLGKIYNAVVYSDLTETTKALDVDCNAITSGNTSLFTATSGQVISISRISAGRKSVAVPSRIRRGAPVFLFGIDDYLEVTDNWQHGLLNFRQGDSFTVLAVIRIWPTVADFRAITGKFESQLSRGYGVLHNTYPTTGISVSDSLTAANTTRSPSSTVGAVNTTGGVVDRSSQTVFGFASGTFSPPGTSVVTGVLGSSGVGSFTNTMPFYIARRGGSNFMDMEFYGAAVFRRALSPAEITTISNYFTGRIA